MPKIYPPTLGLFLLNSLNPNTILTPSPLAPFYSLNPENVPISSSLRPSNSLNPGAILSNFACFNPM